jgi:tetratricopeptide (TPR) repeat protein
MFTDMAGYTALMHRDEEAALRSRARHREAVERWAAQRAGEVLQYFGDGSLSIFASSVEAVHAAIGIQTELSGDPPLRIGLHVGDIAFDAQGAYGDAVNISARLEALCPPGGVAISEKVFDDVRRHPELSVVPMGSVRLKHIPQPLRTYALAVDGLHTPEASRSETAHDGGTAESNLPPSLLERLEELERRPSEPLSGVASVAARVPLVGRRDEIEQLRRALDRAEAGRSSAVFFRGERGVGQTRLTHEVASEARTRGWTVLRGRAHPSERLVPYAPLWDALRPLLRGMEPETLANITPGGGEALCALFPALGPTPDGLDLGPVAPGESRVRLYWQLASMLSLIARHRPLLLTLEDLDFADLASLELLEFLARQSRSESIVFVGEYAGTDPERRRALRALEQSLVGDGSGQVFELQPFDDREAADFVSQALELDPDEGRALAAELYGWTRGNPFFLAGTLRGLVDRGALERKEGRWTRTDLSALEVPLSIRDAVLAWVAHLSPEALALARTLAILARQASYEVVKHVSGLDDATLARGLDELVRQQLLSEAESGWTLTYAFRNPLIRETLRSELALSARRAQHTHLAQALEELYGDDADEHADELAYHFGRAHPGVAGPKVVRYLTLAGEAALRRHANREADQYFQEALDRLEATPSAAAVPRGSTQDMESRILAGLGRARRRCGNVKGSIAVWRRLLAEARDAGDHGAAAALHRQVGLTCMASGDFEEAIEQLAAASEWATATENKSLVVRAQLAEAFCYQSIGRPDDAQAVITEALTLARQVGDPLLLGQVHRSRIQHNVWTGQIPEAREAAARALQLAGDTGDVSVQFWSSWAMAAMEGLVGHTEDMGRWIEECRRGATQAGSPFFELATDELEVELAYARGDWAHGLDVAQRAIELARSTDERLVRPRILVWASLMHLGRGDLEIADAMTQEAWEVSGAAHAEERATFVDLHRVVPAHIGRASYELARGSWDSAVRIAEAGLRIADRSGYIVWAIHHIMPIIAEASIHARDLERASAVGARMRREADRLGHALGRAWADACDAVLTWLAADAETGARSLRQGAEALETIPMTYEAARLRRQLAGRLAEIGDLEGAAAELERAQAVFLRLGARPEMEKVRGQFAEIGRSPPVSSG